MKALSAERKRWQEMSANLYKTVSKQVPQTSSNKYLRGAQRKLESFYERRAKHSREEKTLCHLFRVAAPSKSEITGKTAF